MDERVLMFKIQDAGEGYAVSYQAGEKAASDQVSANALDIDALTALAANAMEGYVSFSEVEEAGNALFRFLAGDRPWAGDLQAELERNDSVHLRLDIESPTLRPLPWEMAYRNEFLALMPQVRFSRVGHTPTPRRSFSRPIQMVILSSTIPEFAAEEEANAIFSVLEQVRRERTVDVYQIRYQSPASLAQIQACDLLHITGHVQMTDDGPMLMMERQALLPLHQLIEVCQRAKPLVVYLSACNGTAVPRGQADKSPATLLQQKGGVPIVIGPYGMTTVWSANGLASTFYWSLASGMSTATAVARARRQLFSALQSKGQRGYPFDWASLVLYQTDEQGLAFGQGLTTGQGGAPAQVQTPLSQQVTLQQPLPVAEAAEASPAQEVALSEGMMTATEADPWATRESPEQTAQVVAQTPVVQADFPGAQALSTTQPLMMASYLPSEPYPPGSPLPLQRPLPPTDEEDQDIGELRAFLSRHTAQERTLDTLRASLSAPDRRRRVAAVQALGLIGARQPLARDMLIDIVAKGEGEEVEPIVRRKAVEQLGRIRDQAALDALLVALADPEQDVRRAAQDALSQARQQTQTEPEHIRFVLPLESAMATEWVADMRKAISEMPSLTPRQRIERMQQIEELRFELICPRPRAKKIDALLETLGTVSAEMKSRTMELKGRIEFAPPEGQHDRTTPVRSLSDRRSTDDMPAGGAQ